MVLDHKIELKCLTFEFKPLLYIYLPQLLILKIKKITWLEIKEKKQQHKTRRQDTRRG